MFGITLDQNILKPEVVIKDKYDLVIIGAGPGGMNAAIYAARNGLSTLIVSKDIGGQLLNTNIIDNYLGFYNISGEALSNHFYEHLNNFKIDKLINHEVLSLKKENSFFKIKLSNEKIINSKSVILSTGGNPRKLNVPGELELTGKGVSYCVICDGAFYKGRDVIVVGGGNSALEAALDLSKYVNKVHIIQNLNKFTGDKLLIDQVINTKNITYDLNSTISKIIGDEALKKVEVISNDKIKDINIDGLFIEIGITPNSKLVKDLVDLNEFNEVVVDNNQQTSLKGLYAIGDVTNNKYKQVITAISGGAIAALEINKNIK
ncbi:MAG: FAD-dependent oxidoreductase [Acholeplasmataceae bacterium]